MKGLVASCVLGLAAGLCPCAGLSQASAQAGSQAAAKKSPPAASPNAAKAKTEAQTALQLEKQGKVPEAEAAWRDVIRLQPRNAQAMARLGLLEAHQEHYAEAIALYRQAIKIDPQMPQLNLNLALALFKSGQFADAAEMFESEYKKQPGDQRITILAGMSRYGAHQYGAAISYLKEAAAADQKNLELRLALAHCYLFTKQLTATLKVYEEILRIDPDSAEADMIAGEALDEQGDNAGAVQQFQAAVKANPKEPNAHFGLAYLLWAQKRYDEAEVEFKAELANDPANYQAMIYLGDTYVKSGQFDQAKGVLEAAGDHLPKVPLIHLDLGIVDQETGDNEAAMRELTQAIVFEPENVNAHFRLAKVYQSMGRRDEAKVEFAKASSLNKKTDDSLYKKIQDANARPPVDAQSVGAAASPPKTDEPKTAGGPKSEKK